MRTGAVLLLLAGLAFSDVVRLRNGRTIEGRVADKGTTIEIETADGTVTVLKEDIERIERKESRLENPAPPRRAPVRLGDPYAHPFFAFKIHLPPGWQRGKEQGKANASFWGPREQAYQPRMDLLIEFDSRDLQDYVSRYKKAFQQAFKNVRFASEEALPVRGAQAAYQFCSLFSDGAPPIPQQALWTFVGADERKYVLSFNCTEAWFDKYRPAVDASMRSIRIYPLPAASREDKQKFVEHYSRGEGAYREGRLQEALPEFEAAAKLVPEFADLHSTVGTIHLKDNRYSDAEAAYRRALELDPADPGYAYNLGVCLLRQLKYEGATEAFRKAVERDPRMEPALTNLGVAYLGRDLNDAARQALEKAVETDPESAPAHYNLGLAYERLDRKRDAERSFRQALSADPRHAEAKSALERLRSTNR